MTQLTQKISPQKQAFECQKSLFEAKDNSSTSKFSLRGRKILFVFPRGKKSLGWAKQDVLMC